jgi:hypothetical protein
VHSPATGFQRWYQSSTACNRCCRIDCQSGGSLPLVNKASSIDPVSLISPARRHRRISHVMRRTGDLLVLKRGH